MIAPSQVINFGNALDSAARFVEAENAFNLALNLAPSDAAVYTSLAHTAKSQGTHAGVLRAGGAGVITSDGPLITSD